MEKIKKSYVLAHCTAFHSKQLRKNTLGLAYLLFFKTIHHSIHSPLLKRGLYKTLSHEFCAGSGVLKVPLYFVQKLEDIDSLIYNNNNDNRRLEVNAYDPHQTILGDIVLNVRSVRKVSSQQPLPSLSLGYNFQSIGPLGRCFL